MNANSPYEQHGPRTSQPLFPLLPRGPRRHLLCRARNSLLLLLAHDSFLEQGTYFAIAVFHTSVVQTTNILCDIESKCTGKDGKTVILCEFPKHCPFGFLSPPSLQSESSSNSILDMFKRLETKALGTWNAFMFQVFCTWNRAGKTKTIGATVITLKRPCCRCAVMRYFTFFPSHPTPRFAFFFLLSFFWVGCLKSLSPSQSLHVFVSDGTYGAAAPSSSL